MYVFTPGLQISMLFQLHDHPGADSECNVETIERRAIKAFGVRPPKVLRVVQIGRNEPTRMALPKSRQGHRDSTSEEYTNTASSLFD
jgi:hypothetical protein